MNARVVELGRRWRSAALAAAWLALASLASSSLAAQEEDPGPAGRGRIVGQVVEAGTGRPVEGVEVGLPLLGRATATDRNGRFLFEGVPARMQHLRIRHIGYGQTEVEVDVPVEETVALTLRLEPSPVELEPLVVEVERELRIRSLERQGFYERRERAAGGEFFGPEYLTRWSGLRVRDILTRAGHARLRGGALVFNRYAPRGCPAAVYVDGRYAGLRVDLPVIEVAAVEVYKSWTDLAGAGSAWYTSQDRCGMVLIWTWRAPNPFDQIDPWADPRRESEGPEVELCEPQGAEAAVVGLVLEGTVRDELTGVALPGARVTAREAQGKEWKTKADRRGRYRFCGLPVGDLVKVRATFAGEEGRPVELGPDPGERVERDLAVAISEPGRVVGRVVDRRTGRALAAAEVVLEGTGRRGQTDEAGYVLLGEVNPGDYALSVRHLGYAEARDSVSVVPDRTTEVRMELSADPVELEPLVVTALRDARLEARGFYERREWGERLGQGRFFGREEIERRSPARVSHLAQEVPGLRVRCTGARSCAVVPARAAGCEHVAVYLDGARVIDEEDTLGGPSLDELVSPMDLAAVEAYPGAASVPAEFAGSTGRCGALVLWTR